MDNQMLLDQIRSMKKNINLQEIPRVDTDEGSAEYDTLRPKTAPPPEDGQQKDKDLNLNSESASKNQEHSQSQSAEAISAIKVVKRQRKKRTAKAKKNEEVQDPTAKDPKDSCSKAQKVNDGGKDSWTGDVLKQSAKKADEVMKSLDDNEGDPEKIEKS